MSEEAKEIDIQKIMEEIKEEVRRNGPYDEIPAFDDIPIPSDKLGGDISRYKLIDSQDLTIPVVYPVESSNPLAKIFKQIMNKLTRCSVSPMAARISETNVKLKAGLCYAMDRIQNQQDLIDELTERIEELEMMVEAEKDESCYVSDR